MCGAEIEGTKTREVFIAMNRIPVRRAQGIERSDAANNNAAGPTLLCGAEKKPDRSHSREFMAYN